MSLDLDAMIERAGVHARNILIEQKQTGLTPAFLFQTGGGEFGVIAGAVDFDSGDQKQALADHARTIMRQHGAIAYSFVSEAWMAVLPVSAPMPRNVRDRSDRIEVVFAVAFDEGGNGRSACWRMVRSPKGKVTALIEMAAPGGADSMAGRFANLLQARA